MAFSEINTFWPHRLWRLPQASDLAFLTTDCRCTNKSSSSSEHNAYTQKGTEKCNQEHRYKATLMQIFEVTHLRSDYETGTQYGDTVLASGKKIQILANEGQGSAPPIAAALRRLCVIKMASIHILSRLLRLDACSPGREAEAIGFAEMSLSKHVSLPAGIRLCELPGASKNRSDQVDVLPLLCLSEAVNTDPPEERNAKYCPEPGGLKVSEASYTAVGSS